MKIKPAKKQEGKLTHRGENSLTSLLKQVAKKSLYLNWEEWGTIATLSVMLWIVAWSVVRSEWINPQPSLVLVLFLSLACGLVLGKSRLPGIAAHSLALVLGAGVVIWQGASLQPGPGIAAQLGQLVGELRLWWAATSSGATNPGTVQIALLISILVWVLGYVSIWFIIKRQNPWVAVSLGATGFLINQSNLAEIEYTLFLYYIVAAMFLVAQTTFVKHYLWFGKRPIYHREWGIKYFLPSVLCLGILALSLVSLTPHLQAAPLGNLVKTEASWWQDIDSYWQDFFAKVPAKKPIPGYTSEGLRFGSAPELSDEELFIVRAERPSYWWTQRYDIYTSDGWLSSPKYELALENGATRTQLGPTPPHINLTYTVIPKTYTNILLGAGEPLSSNITIAIRTLKQQTFDIYFTDSSGDSSLPPDVSQMASAVRDSLTGYSVSEGRLRQQLPEDLRLVAFLLNNDEQMVGIKITRPLSRAEDIVTILSPKPLLPDQSYSLTARIPVPTAMQLLDAGENYPQWVTDRYLQLPPDFPETIRQLAEDLTDDFPYKPCDKALVINQFLSKIPYSDDFEAPPPDVDGVEHFLFTQQSGNCVYFASAMVVMLRSIGVPSRLSIGYLPGEWDEDQGGYIVRESDYHAWPEIYFPGYGWIQFEATPGRSLGEHDEYLWLLAEDPVQEAPQPQQEERTTGEDYWAFAKEYLDEEEYGFFAEEYFGSVEPPTGTGSSSGEGQQTSPVDSLSQSPPSLVEDLPIESLPPTVGETPNQAPEYSDENNVGATSENLSPGPEGNITEPETPASNLPWLVLGITAVMLVLGVGSYQRFVRFSGLGAVGTVYARMCQLASLAGLGSKPQQTALEYCTRLSAALPNHAEAISSITRIYMESQYSRNKDLETSQKEKLQEFWRQVRRSLLLRLFHIQSVRMK
jgi:hypothetical protein